MLAALVFLPLIALICLAWSRPVSHLFLYIYLPCLLLIPTSMFYSVRGVDLTPCGMVGAVLAVWGWMARRGSLRWSLLDACVIANAGSIFYSNLLHQPTSISLIDALQNGLLCVFPYFIGRTLVEQEGLRARAAKVVVICLCIVSVLSVWEFRMTSNLFQKALQWVNAERGSWTEMKRWGYARIVGPFTHPIVAGMVFSSGLMLQLWLMSAREWGAKVRRPSRALIWLPTLLIVLGLFMTQSRGPWIGCALGLIVGFVGLAKNRGRAAMIALGLLVVSTGGLSVALNRYTGVKMDKVANGDQQNAVYRRELLNTYEPMVRAGGLWGWGRPTRLRNGEYGYKASQPSVDNDYLLVTLAQGYVGFVLLALMLGLNLRRLALLQLRCHRREDILFTSILLGISVGAAFTLTTVYLAPPMEQLLFLFFGWSESVRAVPALSSAEEQKEVLPFQFERVFA